MRKITECGIRTNIKDVWWNAFMVKDCTRWQNSMPLCETKRVEVPQSLITWKEAIALYNRYAKTGAGFKSSAYVCFYLDDYGFDGMRGIWFNSAKALEILRRFSGIITPDFSTYDDFPTALKVWNTYRMRAFGCWMAENGVNVINNVRWSYDTKDICFCGIPKNNIVCLGTVASGLYHHKERWAEYEYNLLEMTDVLTPQVVLVYGSSRYPFFDKLIERGIVVKSYPSRRNRGQI